MLAPITSLPALKRDGLLSDWPVPRPADWRAIVNRAQSLLIVGRPLEQRRPRARPVERVVHIAADVDAQWSAHAPG